MRQFRLMILGLAFFSSCGDFTNKKQDTVGPVRVVAEGDSNRDGRIEEAEKRLTKLENRITALEKAFGEFQDLNNAQQHQIVDIVTVFRRLSLLEGAVEEFKNNTVTKDQLEKQVADLLNRISQLKRTSDKLVTDRDNTFFRIDAIEAWEAETKKLIENLKSADLTTAVADLQTWKGNVAQPLADLIVWKKSAEERLQALETLGEITKQCMATLDVKTDVNSPVPSQSLSAACDGLRKQVQALSGLYVQFDQMNAQFNELAGRIASLEASDADRLKAVTDLSKALIRSQFVTVRGVRPCGIATGIFIRLSAREAYTDELVYLGSRGTQGALEDGDFVVKEGTQKICSFKVSSPAHPLSSLQQGALGIENQSLRLKRVSWTSNDGSKIAFDVLSPTVGDVE